MWTVLFVFVSFGCSQMIQNGFIGIIGLTASHIHISLIEGRLSICGTDMRGFQV